MGNQIIKRANQVKYLGVVIDDKFSWKPHIQTVRSKLARGCWILSKLSRIVDISTLKNIYYGLIYSNIIYCISCWGWVGKRNLLNENQIKPKTKLSPLEVLQNRALRIMCKVPRQTSSSPLYQKLGLLKLQDIYFLQITTIMHRIKNNNWKGNFDIETIQDIHNYPTRFSQDNYYTGKIHCEKSRGALTVAGPAAWRNVPQDLKTKDLSTFKSAMKLHLIQKY